MKTDTTDTDTVNKKLFLFPELSYQLRGIFFSMANQYGLGHKEKLYHHVFIDCLGDLKLKFEHEKHIPIYSWKDGRIIGTYIPDFIIEKKVLVEFKSEPFLLKQFINQIYSYLRVTEYQLAFIVNFGETDLLIKRMLFTNDRKPHLKYK